MLEITLVFKPGCEDFYDPKAKKKKADIAESLGADIGDKVLYVQESLTHFKK